MCFCWIVVNALCGSFLFNFVYTVYTLTMTALTITRGRMQIAAAYKKSFCSLVDAHLLLTQNRPRASIPARAPPAAGDLRVLRRQRHNLRRALGHLLRVLRRQRHNLRVLREHLLREHLLREHFLRHAIVGRSFSA